MKKIFTIIILCLSVSCAHRFREPLPNSKAKTDKSKINEFEKVFTKHQSYRETIFNNINIGNKRYRLNTTRYLFDYINPEIYPKLATSSWGKYLGYLALVPLYFFANKMISEEASLANVSLSLISFSGAIYGLNIERDKNNKLINKYNQDLKIKLNIINLPLN